MEGLTGIIQTNFQLSLTPNLQNVSGNNEQYPNCAASASHPLLGQLALLLFGSQMQLSGDHGITPNNTSPGTTPGDVPLQFGRGETRAVV